MAMMTAYDPEGQAQAATNEADAYVGQIGDKIALSLTLVGHKELNNSFRISTLLTFKDRFNNGFVWFKSGWASALNVGDTYTVSGTIKKHNEFRGNKQTILTRCKIS